MSDHDALVGIAICAIFFGLVLVILALGVALGA